MSILKKKHFKPGGLFPILLLLSVAGNLILGYSTYKYYQLAKQESRGSSQPEDVKTATSQSVPGKKPDQSAVIIKPSKKARIKERAETGIRERHDKKSVAVHTLGKNESGRRLPDAFENERAAYAAVFPGKMIPVFISAEEAAYMSAQISFAEEIGLPVKVFNMEGDVKKGEKVMQDILIEEPSLIFTLGAKASYIAKTVTLSQEHLNIPIVFAQVLNWERYNLLAGTDNVCGISAEVEPDLQFSEILPVIPNVTSMGVVYSRHSYDLMPKARAAAAMLDIDLLEATIQRPSEFKAAFHQIADDIDTYWLLGDPIVFTVENCRWLVDECIQKHIVSLAESENMAIKGALISIYPDERDIGIQAAEMAKMILFENRSPASLGVEEPRRMELSINKTTAAKIGVAIDDTVIGIADNVFE